MPRFTRICVQKRVKCKKNAQKKWTKFKKEDRIAEGARVRGRGSIAPVERLGADARWCGRELAACKHRSPSGQQRSLTAHAAMQLQCTSATDRTSIRCRMGSLRHEAWPVPRIKGRLPYSPTPLPSPLHTKLPLPQHTGGTRALYSTQTPISA